MIILDQNLGQATFFVKVGFYFGVVDMVVLKTIRRPSHLPQSRRGPAVPVVRFEVTTYCDQFSGDRLHTLHTSLYAKGWFETVGLNRMLSNLVSTAPSHATAAGLNRILSNTYMYFRKY